MSGESEHNEIRSFPDKGDDLGWEKFFAEHDTLIASVCAWRKWHFSPEVRADVLQRVRLELVKSGETFKEGSSLFRFIKSIAVHRCIDEVRRQVRRKWSVQASAIEGTNDEGFDIIAAAEDPDADVLKAIIAREKGLYLREVVEGLGETCKTAIHYFYFEGLSYAEISERVGVTVNTVGSRLAKCLSRLREEIKNSDSMWEYFRQP